MSAARDRKVTIKPTRPVQDGIKAELVGDDVLSGGVGTWEAVPRPRRREAVEWTGTTGYTYVLTLLLDGMEDRPGRDESIEPQCRALQKWAGQPTKKTDEPSVVKLRGPLQTPESVRWVITDLAWGPKVRNRNGNRVQQYVTVTFKEYQDAVLLKGPAAKHRHKKGDH